MTIPPPRPGAVIRYAFLWSSEARAGAAEAVKDRPCAIVVAVRRESDGAIRVVVAPITHSPPTDARSSIEIPARACASLGLDGGRHRLRTDEVNALAWPGFDIRTIPGTAGRFEYGMLPRAIYERLRAAIVENQRARRLRGTARD